MMYHMTIFENYCLKTLLKNCIFFPGVVCIRAYNLTNLLLYVEKLLDSNFQFSWSIYLMKWNKNKLKKARII